MLCFVKNDPDKIYTYQWSDNAWVKSKIGSGVEKIDTVADQQNLNPEPGDIIYIKETGQLLQYTKDLIWNSLQTLHISDDEPEDKGVLWLTNAKTSQYQENNTVVQALNNRMTQIEQMLNLLKCLITEGVI